MRGFTLIETLVYLALFSLLMGGIASAAYLLSASSSRLTTNAMLLQEEQFILAKIERAIASANTVSTPAAGATGNTLTLPGAVFTLSGGDAFLDGARLNNTNVTVDALTFTRSAAAPDSITTHVAMSAKTDSGMTLSQAATSTMYLRK